MRRLTILTLLTTLAVPGVAGAALGQRPLERGDRGGDVKRLQAALARLHVERLSRDGVYGTRTQRAVRRYERRERLSTDGRVSTGQARGMLRRVGWTVPPPPASSSSPHPPPPEGATFPVSGRVTWGDGFGDRGGAHDGIDLLSDCGTPLVAITEVTITARDSGGKAGRWLGLTDADGHEWIYMHMQDVTTHTGDVVDAGAPVGTVGQTGNATACHLHIELRPKPGRNGGAAPVDPARILHSLER